MKSQGIQNINIGPISLITNSTGSRYLLWKYD